MSAWPLIVALSLAALLGAADITPAPVPEATQPVAAVVVAPPPAVFTTVSIANAKARVVLSTQRGGIVRFELLDERPTVLSLPLRRKAGVNAAQPGDEGKALAVLDDFRHDLSSTHLNLHNFLTLANESPNIDGTANMAWEVVETTKDRAAMRLVLADRGLTVTLAYAMDPLLPRVACTLTVTNTSTADETITPRLYPVMGIHQDYAPGETAYVCAAVHTGGEQGSLKRTDLPGASGVEALMGHSPFDYAGIKSRFFAAMWSPSAVVAQAMADTTPKRDDAGVGASAGTAAPATSGLTVTALRFDGPASELGKPVPQICLKVDYPASTVKPGASRTETWSLTCVGMSKDALLPLSEAEKRMQYTDGMYRFFKILAKALSWCLNLINQVVHNYGVALVVLTILLKAALHRTTFKQQESMLKMQRLAPELKVIQECFKGDRQQFGLKTMELYKKNGVNPLGGCLPILIQMPMFMALFQVFSHNADMRGAGFLWASDLTLPDAVWGPAVSYLSWATINPLALIYIGVTVWMSYSMKVPVGGDEQQAQMMKMMRWMPVIFGVIFYAMPSGLVLYFTVNAILSTLEIRYVKKKLGMT